MSGAAEVASGYVDDVFSTYTYTGTGSSQSIVNGIDLSGQGGLVWAKRRDSAVDHALIDTARGKQNLLRSNLADAQITSGGADYITSFDANGYTMSGGWGLISGSGGSYVSWTFRKAPRFFDVQTKSHTNGVADTIDLSSLGTVGMVAVKRASGGTGNWMVWHRSQTPGKLTFLNLPDAEATSSDISVSGTTLTLSAALGTGIYVIYAWAHDPLPDGIIQCGTYTEGASPVDVSLGWEPQYVLIKPFDSAAHHWDVADTMRRLESDGIVPLFPSTSDPDGVFQNLFRLRSFGFNAPDGKFGPGRKVLYLAIRRPNKPITSGTQAYKAINRTGTGAAVNVTGVGFSPDAVISMDRTHASDRFLFSKVSGASNYIKSNAASAEATDATGITSYLNDGIAVGSDAVGSVNLNTWPFITHFLRRAPGFFDVVCDTGTGVAHAITHNLTVAPELIIRKDRSNAQPWQVWHSTLANTEKLVLNTTAAKVTDANAWNSTAPGASSFTVGTAAATNTSGDNFVTYLFATLAGISKVGSYTGNGTSQTINCGFAAGARFVLIKRINSTGDWYAWDSVRGIVAGDDPHTSLNTSVTEVTTDDSIDPDSSGFIVNQVAATNINVNAASYIYLAIA